MWFIQLLTLLMVVVNGIFCADDCGKPFVPSDLKKCCDLPILIDQNLRETCFKEVEADSDAWDGLKNFTKKLKFAECLFKKGDAIIDGKPSVKEIKKMVKTILEDYAEWTGTFNAAVDRCVPDVIAKDVEVQKRTSQPPFNVKNINTIFGHLVGCIVADLMFDCPTASRHKSSYCTEMTNNLKNCFRDFPPRFMLPERS